jgi:hypothetical protein
MAGAVSGIHVPDFGKFVKGHNERLYSAKTPNSHKNVRILPSGSVYKVTACGAWIRLNHPKNKHDRRAELGRAS